MGYSRNGAAFYYAEQKRLKNADDARRAAGKGSAFGDAVAIFLFFCVVAIIGAVIELASAALAFLSF